MLTLFIKNTITFDILETSIPPNMPRTSSSWSKSSSKSSTGATQGRGLVTGYNWGPPEAANSNSKEFSSTTQIVCIQMVKRTSLLKSIYL